MPARSTKAAVVTQKALGVDVETGLEQRTFFIGDGEQAKSLSSVEDLCRGFARFGLTRTDLVVAVGGGVVTDVAGFAVAVYHRGVPVAHVATTLLGQVDAAIGGKTGVNLPEEKTWWRFWQPIAVICDTEVLSTLPHGEYRSGLGEMAKYAFLGVPNLPIRDGRSSDPLRRAEGELCSPRRTARPRASLRAAPGGRAAERCSITATLWHMLWRQSATTTCGTAKRWR